jgi:hypothetical protein
MCHLKRCGLDFRANAAQSRRTSEVELYRQKAQELYGALVS